MKTPTNQQQKGKQFNRMMSKNLEKILHRERYASDQKAIKTTTTATTESIIVQFWSSEVQNGYYWG